MPILKAQPSSGGSNLSWDLTKYTYEDGTYPAVLADCIYEENVLRKKFDSDEQEEVDLAVFLFAYFDDEDEIVFAQSFGLKVTTSEKSTFIKFLSNMRGKTPPLDGTYDWHMEMGRKVNLTIEKKTAKKSGIVYGAVTGVAPLSKKYLDDAPDFDDLPEIPSGRRSKRPEQEDEEKMDKPKRKSRKAKKTEDEDDDNPF